VDGELPFVVGQGGHGLLVQLGEQAAAFEFADEHLRLDERLDRRHVAAGQALGEALDQILERLVFEQSLVALSTSP